MRDMNDEERKVFDEKQDYIAKLKDSMAQEEMDSLLPKEIQEMIDAPVFTFGQVKLYPRGDLNRYLESAYSGSPVSTRLNSLEGEVSDLGRKLEDTKKEANEYVAEIERLEEELKEAKDRKFRAQLSQDPNEASMVGVNVGIKTFYPGECNGFMYCMVSDWMRNHRPQIPSEGVRAYELAKDFRDALLEQIDLKKAEEYSKEFKEKIRKAVDEAFASTPTDITPLLQIGFTNKTRKNSPHFKVAWLDRDDYTFIIAKTPSDKNSAENCKRNIISRICI